MDPASNTCTLVLRIGAHAGKLCGLVNPMDSSKKQDFTLCMTDLLRDLLRAANSLGLDLIRCVLKKQILNGRKYPVELCGNKIVKWTKHSDKTGVTHDNHTLAEEFRTHSTVTVQRFAGEMEGIIQNLKMFAKLRNWSYTPRNLVLALLSEVGELSELVAWKGEHLNKQSFNSQELDKLAIELADVTIYLLRLAQNCNLATDICRELAVTLQ